MLQKVIHEGTHNDVLQGPFLSLWVWLQIHLLPNEMVHAPKGMPQRPSTANRYRSLQRQEWNYLPAPRGDSPHPGRRTTATGQLSSPLFGRPGHQTARSPPDQTHTLSVITHSQITLCMYVCARMRVCAFVCLCICVCVCVRVCTCASMRVCTRV